MLACHTHSGTEPFDSPLACGPIILLGIDLILLQSPQCEGLQFSNFSRCDQFAVQWSTIVALLAIETSCKKETPSRFDGWYCILRSVRDSVN